MNLRFFEPVEKEKRKLRLASIYYYYFEILRDERLEAQYGRDEKLLRLAYKILNEDISLFKKAIIGFLTLNDKRPKSVLGFYSFTKSYKGVVSEEVAKVANKLGLYSYEALDLIREYLKPQFKSLFLKFIEEHNEVKMNDLRDYRWLSLMSSST